MPYTVGIFPNMLKDRVRACLPDIMALLQKYGFKILLPQNMAQDKTLSYRADDTASLMQMDAGISLGGDGTFLQMARYLSPLKIPVFGVNFGKLGFLAETEMNDFEKALQKLAQQDFEIEERSQLRAIVIRNGQIAVQAHALNDMVAAKGHFSKLAEVEEADDLLTLILSHDAAFMPLTGLSWQRLPVQRPILYQPEGRWCIQALMYQSSLLFVHMRFMRAR